MNRNNAVMLAMFFVEYIIGKCSSRNECVKHARNRASLDSIEGTFIHAKMRMI